MTCSGSMTLQLAGGDALLQTGEKWELSDLGEVLTLLEIAIEEQ